MSSTLAVIYMYLDLLISSLNWQKVSIKAHALFTVMKSILKAADFFQSLEVRNLNSDPNSLTGFVFSFTHIVF